VFVLLIVLLSVSQVLHSVGILFLRVESISFLFPPFCSLRYLLQFSSFLFSYLKGPVVRDVFSPSMVGPSFVPIGNLGLGVIQKLDRFVSSAKLKEDFPPFLFFFYPPFAPNSASFFRVFSLLLPFSGSDREALRLWSFLPVFLGEFFSLYDLCCTRILLGGVWGSQFFFSFLQLGPL